MKFSLKPNLILSVWYQYIWQTSWRYLWLLFIPVFVAVLQWLLNIELLIDILATDSGLSFFEKIDFIADGVGRVFTELNDWTPLAFILISVFQSTALTLFIVLKRQAKLKKKVAVKQATSMGVAILGAGCVACGGSLVAPLLSVLASNVSVTLAQSVGDILLFAAVLLSLWSLSNIASASYFKKKS